MSIAFSNSVWASSKAKGNARLVLLCLADHANKDGYCWPGVKCMAKRCRLSERTVQRCLRELEGIKEVVVKRQGGPAYSSGSTNGYWIVLKPFDKPVTTTDDISEEPGDAAGHGLVTASSPPPVSKLSPKASVEPSEENINRTSGSPNGSISSLELSDETADDRVEDPNKDVRHGVPLKLSAPPARGQLPKSPVASPGEPPKGDNNNTTEIPEGSNVAPLALSEKTVKPTAAFGALQTSALDRFCDAVVKLRANYSGNPVPKLAAHQRARIKEGLELFEKPEVGYLLVVFRAAWGHWDHIKGRVGNSYVEGFHAKFFWPPENGFKHISKVDDFLFDEGKKYPEWWEEIIDDVIKVRPPSSTLTSDTSLEAITPPVHLR